MKGSSKQDEGRDFENMSEDEYPVEEFTTDFIGAYNLSLTVNLVLAVILLLNVCVSYYLNTRIEDPYGTGVKTDIRGIDDTGRVSALTLHRRDSSNIK